MAETAETAGEQLVRRLVLQGEADGRLGREIRSEHPAYGHAYWRGARERLVVSRERILCVARGTHQRPGGVIAAGMFIVWDDVAQARYTPSEVLAASVRDGARVIDADGQDVTQYVTLMQ